MSKMSEELSPAAKKAIARIRVLQVLTERTGFMTKHEQFQILMALSDEDLLAASVEISRMKRGLVNGLSNPR
jgi:hypothetical protein